MVWAADSWFVPIGMLPDVKCVHNDTVKLSKVTLDNLVNSKVENKLSHNMWLILKIYL